MLWASGASLWRVLEHDSATVAFRNTTFCKTRWLRHHPDVMLLADRGFANHELMGWCAVVGGIIVCVYL